MNYEPKRSYEPIHYKADRLKLFYLEKLMQDCRGKTTLIFFESPRYASVENNIFEPVKRLCKKYDIPFYDHYSDTFFIHNKNLFQDSGHMNRMGSVLYTKSIIKEIKASY
jgi:hypothetical protein